MRNQENILNSESKSEIIDSLEELPKDKLIDLISDQIDKDQEDKRIKIDKKIGGDNEENYRLLESDTTDNSVENEILLDSEDYTDLSDENFSISEHDQIFNIFDNEKSKFYLLLNIVKTEDISNLVLIRYEPVSEKLINDISENVDCVKIICAGFNQQIPRNRENVEIFTSRNPNDIRRQGIITTNIADDLSGDTIITYDSLDKLLEYTSLENGFKFIYTLIKQTTKFNSKFILSTKKSNISEQNIRTLKPLFDCSLELNDRNLSIVSDF